MRAAGERWLALCACPSAGVLSTVQCRRTAAEKSRVTLHHTGKVRAASKSLLYRATKQAVQVMQCGVSKNVT